MSIKYLEPCLGHDTTYICVCSCTMLVERLDKSCRSGNQFSKSPPVLLGSVSLLCLLEFIFLCYVNNL